MSLELVYEYTDVSRRVCLPFAVLVLRTVSSVIVQLEPPSTIVRVPRQDPERGPQIYMLGFADATAGISAGTPMHS